MALSKAEIVATRALLPFVAEGGGVASERGCWEQAVRKANATKGKVERMAECRECPGWAWCLCARLAGRSDKEGLANIAKGFQVICTNGRDRPSRTRLAE